MTSFLQILAHDLLQRFGRDLSRVAVVFPNKRASLFLNQELARQAAVLFPANGSGEQSGEPLWTPAYITISDLFRHHSTLTVADQILLVCRLYDVYVRSTGYETETLDRFYDWGLLLLSDFDDIDKNMADASRVFQLVTDLHELDTADYLSSAQREALQGFFGAFPEDKTSQMREKFLHLWSRLHDIYTEFRRVLRAEGLAYEGMLYRDVAESETLPLDYDTYCFAGFNMLHTVEQRLFQRLKDADPAHEGGQPRALFYWDYDAYYINPQHEAGHFIGEYISRFPDAVGGERRNLVESKRGTGLTYISAQTENLQARYVRDWLLTADRWRGGKRTAIVLCDESLLQTVIRSLPDEVRHANITLGFPLTGATVTTFVQHLVEMQLVGSASSGVLRVRYVNSVLRHPYMRRLSKACPDMLADLAHRKATFPSRASLWADDALRLVFCDLKSDTDRALYAPDETADGNERLLLWLQAVLRRVATTDAATLPPLDTEAIFRTHQVLARLLSLVADGTLRVEQHTLRRLLMQITAQTTVPYHGEPLEGIQIMGVLETRCLDFDHLLVLSTNEGNMPKGVDDTSFIPHSVRQAHGLTTVEHKVGIYSYYFHRLLQRVPDATLTFNSSTEGLRSGEMSRFMLQLLVESGMPIRRLDLQTGQETVATEPCVIRKDDTVLRQLQRLTSPGYKISPTALERYLRCPARFYYEYVAAIRESDDSDPDELDDRVFGNIFHAAAQFAYTDLRRADGTVGGGDIDRLLADSRRLEAYIDRAFAENFFHLEGEAALRRPHYNGLQTINRRVVMRLLRTLLAYDRRHAPFRVLGIEMKVYETVSLNIGGEQRQACIGGTIDRLDMVGENNGKPVIRVIDYKTGFLKNALAMSSVEDIFLPENMDKHADYYLQTLLYSSVVSRSPEMNADGLPVKPLLLFVQNLGNEKYTPELVIAKRPINDIRQYDAQYRTALAGLIAEIHDPAKPFEPRPDRTCEYCPYSALCSQ